MNAFQKEFPDTFLTILMWETMTFTTTKLEIVMTLFWKKLTKNAPSALFFYKGANIFNNS